MIITTDLGARLQKRKRGRKTTLRREAKRAMWRGRWGRWQERNLLMMMMMMVMNMMTRVRSPHCGRTR